MIYKNIYETIGNTPMIKLNNIISDDMAEVVVKLESLNPGGSIKDRISLAMIEEAERAGILKKGDTIVEPTSGNTGIGLAMVGASMGYGVVIVMPETMSIERRRLILAYGAKIVLTDGSKGMKGAIEMAERLVKEKEYFMPQQFLNNENPKIHMKTTALEILSQTNGRVDALVAGVGTGGTITGVGKILKRDIPGVKIVVVEPDDSPVLSGGTPGSHKLQGIGAGFIPEILDRDVIDEVIRIKTDEAFEASKKLCQKEGILVGISSGAAAAAAIKVAKELGIGKRVVFIAPDTGERYLSTELFDLE